MVVCLSFSICGQMLFVLWLSDQDRLLSGVLPPLCVNTALTLNGVCVWVSVCTLPGPEPVLQV